MAADIERVLSAVQETMVTIEKPVDIIVEPQGFIGDQLVHHHDPAIKKAVYRYNDRDIVAMTTAGFAGGAGLVAAFAMVVGEVTVIAALFCIVATLVSICSVGYIRRLRRTTEKSLQAYVTPHRSYRWDIHLGKRTLQYNEQSGVGSYQTQLTATLKRIDLQPRSRLHVAVLGPFRDRVSERTICSQTFSNMLDCQAYIDGVAANVDCDTVIATPDIDAALLTASQTIKMLNRSPDIAHIEHGPAPKAP